MSSSPSSISASDSQSYRLRLQLDSTKSLLQKYCTSETCWFRSFTWTGLNWPGLRGFPGPSPPPTLTGAVLSLLTCVLLAGGQFQYRKRSLAMSTACWLGVDSCCKARTESQTFLTLECIKKDQHSDTFLQTPIGRLGGGGGCISLKPMFLPSVPLSPFPEASYASLTARFLS